MSVLPDELLALTHENASDPMKWGRPLSTILSA